MTSLTTSKITYSKKMLSMAFRCPCLVYNNHSELHFTDISNCILPHWILIHLSLLYLLFIFSIIFFCFIKIVNYEFSPPFSLLFNKQIIRLAQNLCVHIFVYFFVLKEQVQRILDCLTFGKSEKSYHEDVRSFCLTLHFYSPMA